MGLASFVFMTIHFPGLKRGDPLTAQLRFFSEAGSDRFALFLGLLFVFGCFLL